VPGVSRSLDDLTAALANESKTLLEVTDRQTEYPDGWDSRVITARVADFRRRHTVGSPHFESAVDIGRGCSLAASRSLRRSGTATTPSRPRCPTA
jgi:hypothetical protein